MATDLGPLEKVIEARVVKWAKAHDFMCLKLNTQGQRSWPDRLFLSPKGVVVFIELKRKGGVLSEGQKDCIEKLTARHPHVYVCYDAESAIAILEAQQ